MGSLTVQPSIPCNLCGRRDAVVVGTRDRDGKALRTVACRGCGLVWTDPRPGADEVKAFYSSSYRIEYKGGYEPQLKHVYRAGLIAVERYKAIRAYLRPDSRVLDIGASSGEFVYLMRALGYEARGIEPNRGYGEYARDRLGLPVEIGMAGDFELEPESLDVVTMHHVFEHLEDPLGHLRSLHGALREGGIVAIEVPNVTFRGGSPANRFHLGHLYNFNMATLEAIGRAGGYSVHDSETSPDGGVIRTVLKKAAAMDPVAEIPGNFDLVAETLLKFTDKQFYLTAAPYKKPFAKLRRKLNEGNAVGKAADGREVLDAIVARVKGSAAGV